MEKDILFRLMGSSEDKVSACNAGDLGSIPGLGRSPGEGEWLPIAHGVFKELDTIEQLSLHFH